MPSSFTLKSRKSKESSPCVSEFHSPLTPGRSFSHAREWISAAFPRYLSARRHERERKAPVEEKKHVSVSLNFSFQMFTSGKNLVIPQKLSYLISRCPNIFQKKKKKNLELANHMTWKRFMVETIIHICTK